MKNTMRKMNINQLRDIAVSLGANRKELYGASKDAMICIISKLKSEKSSK